jgi:hypothetical protein
LVIYEYDRQLLLWYRASELLLAGVSIFFHYTVISASTGVQNIIATGTGFVLGYLVIKPLFSNVFGVSA